MKNWLFLNVTNHEKKLPYYLYGAGNVYDQENVYRPKGCPWYQLNICLSGRGVLKMNNQEKEITEGDSMIIYPDIPHEYYPIKGKMIVSWIAFDGFQVNSMLNSIGIDSSGVYRLNRQNEIHQTIRDILPLQDRPILEKGFEGSRYVYNFLLNLMKNYSSDKETGQNSMDKVKPAIDYMNEHLADPISIENIAESMEITPQHFCLLFKNTMNQRPFEFLNSLRINHSKHLLINEGQLPVKEVSLLSGYPNHSYFCHLFKNRERVTPAEFRKLYKQNNY